MNTIKHFIKSVFTALLLIFIISENGSAQEKQAITSQNNDWKFIVEPYMMFPNMKGAVGLGDLPEASLDANSGDILGQLKMGFMLNAEASKGKWTIGSDLLYMSLAVGVQNRNLITSGEVTLKQLGWEVSGLYQTTPWLELGVGGILNSIDAGMDIQVKSDASVIGGPSFNKTKSATKTWFDPMLITRIKSKSGEKFVYMFRGEVGGFGVGSDFAWNMQAYAGYQFSKLFQITGGYRIISMDYESGSGNNRFLYNVDTSGPVIRFGFNF
jgi:hypothetical protein